MSLLLLFRGSSIFPAAGNPRWTVQTHYRAYAVDLDSFSFVISTRHRNFTFKVPSE